VEIIRAEINVSNFSKGQTSVLFKRTPEFILELAFEEDYCIFSINNPLNLFSFCFKFGPAGPEILYLFILYILW